MPGGVVKYALFPWPPPVLLSSSSSNSTAISTDVVCCCCADQPLCGASPCIPYTIPNPNDIRAVPAVGGVAALAIELMNKQTRARRHQCTGLGVSLSAGLLFSFYSRVPAVLGLSLTPLLYASHTCSSLCIVHVSNEPSLAVAVAQSTANTTTNSTKMSKHFCCCLPVRFGVFVLSLLTLLGSAGTAFAIWWILANGTHSPFSPPTVHSPCTPPRVKFAPGLTWL
jgi:hypothetical protein